MEQNAVTTQPLRSLQYTDKSPTEVSPMFHSSIDDTHNLEKENGPFKENTPEPLTEVTAVFNSETGLEEKENTGGEKEKRRQEKREDVELADCCCVYTGMGDSDPLCMYLLCHWICDCFRGIGTCTDSCFEGCASCLGNCCEDSSGNGGCVDCCCSCDDGGDCCSDGLTGCLECCVSCDTCSG